MNEDFILNKDKELKCGTCGVLGHSSYSCPTKDEKIPIKENYDIDIIKKNETPIERFVDENNKKFPKDR